MTGIDLTTLLNDGRKKQTLKTEGKVAEKARKRSFKRNWGKGHPLIHTYDFFILIYHFSPSELCIYNSHSLFKILKSKTVNSFIHFLHFLWRTWGIVPSAEKHFRRMLNWEGWIHYKFAQFWCSVCFIDSTRQIWVLFSETHGVSSLPFCVSHRLAPPPLRSNWLKPCCGRRAALWQVCLLSAGFNCFLVACVILVVVLLLLELLIDTKLLQCEWKMRGKCGWDFFLNWIHPHLHKMNHQWKSLWRKCEFKQSLSKLQW